MTHGTMVKFGLYIDTFVVLRSCVYLMPTGPFCLALEKWPMNRSIHHCFEKKQYNLMPLTGCGDDMKHRVSRHGKQSERSFFPFAECATVFQKFQFRGYVVFLGFFLGRKHP